MEGLLNIYAENFKYYWRKCVLGQVYHVSANWNLLDKQLFLQDVYWMMDPLLYGPDCCCSMDFIFFGRRGPWNFESVHIQWRNRRMQIDWEILISNFVLLFKLLLYLWSVFFWLCAYSCFQCLIFLVCGLLKFAFAASHLCSCDQFLMFKTTPFYH